MSEGELEKVMLKFMHHEADILVATTIIENGLDIPLCNTILINRAERLGLVGALPVAWTRGPVEPARVCLPAVAGGN